MSIRRPVVSAALALLLALTGACGGSDVPTPPGTGTPTGPEPRPELAGTYRASGLGPSGATFVHLFSWPWPDVAAECENVLGPAGVEAVQVSPPQEHIVLPPGHPWWQRYQPVSYQLEGRSGSTAEFADMVSRCAAAGVDIYVDAVLNHMTAGSGTGSAGTVYTKYEYPGLYDASDFHPPCSINSYQNEAQVQDCELVGLADLDTGQADVREHLADYLLSLTELGVAGFRIDAAKHMQPVELDLIVDAVNEAVQAAGGDPVYLFAEVIDNGGEAVTVGDYFGLGFSSGGYADITEFRFRNARDAFTGAFGGNLAALRNRTLSAGVPVPSDKAVVFIENHDTQRDGGGLTWRDGDRYRLAQLWMLAQPYGYPKIMSSYDFNGRDQSPPTPGDGTTRPVTCPATVTDTEVGGWVCEHRDPALLGMVGFRRAVAGTGAGDWWDNGGDAAAFSRGDRGFVAMSLEAAPVQLDVATSLPPGSYCDVVSGRAGAGGCTGLTVEVTAGGRVEMELAPGQAVALHVDARPQGQAAGVNGPMG